MLTIRQVIASGTVDIRPMAHALSGQSLAKVSIGNIGRTLVVIGDKGVCGEDPGVLSIGWPDEDDSTPQE